MRATVFLTALTVGFGAFHTAAAQAPGAASAVIDTSCGYDCLTGHVQDYMAALVERDPSRLDFAPDVRFTENNVEIPIGDGLWGSISGVAEEGMQAADAQTGNAAWFGVIEEHGNPAYYAMRLKVVEGEITEVETVVSRLPDPPKPFGDPESVRHDPAFAEILPEEERRPRERLIAVADGYFDTVELNDGTIFTPFDEDCQRLENGISTTSSEGSGSATIAQGCEAQFKLGIFRINKRVRERRFPLVDEKRGVVVASGFFDHANTFDEYELTNGRTLETVLKWPNSITLLEAFKIKDGKIYRVEAVFTYVPYFMHSPFYPVEAPEVKKAPSAKAHCDAECLTGIAEDYMAALVRQDPSDLPWAEQVRFSENNVPMMIGDGLWGTISARSDNPLIVPDPESGNVAWFGTVAEHGQPSFYAMNIEVENGRISNVETMVARDDNPGPYSDPEAYRIDSVYSEELPADARTPRERMIDIVDGYFSTKQLNDGTLFTQFTEDCSRLANGVVTTEGTDCASQLQRGVEKPVTRARDRRFHVVDEARGLVVATAMLDKAVRSVSYPTTDGETRELDIPYPYSRGVMEVFKIRDGRIARMDAVSVFLPYSMPVPSQ